VGWLPATGPATGWTPRPLPDQLVLRRRTHELTWLRDGQRRASWTVAVGTAATPTPLGRTFVLGRTSTHGSVYAGLDALALGSVPDDRHALSAAFRGAHTGIHSWYRADVFGRDTSNGCIRVPRAGQRTLLTNIAPGTSLLVLD
jgi:lipoprotein-anchoring transpeptidase ErfK/SrfK